MLFALHLKSRREVIGGHLKNCAEMRWVAVPVIPACLPQISEVYFYSRFAEPNQRRPQEFGNHPTVKAASLRHKINESGDGPGFLVVRVVAHWDSQDRSGTASADHGDACYAKTVPRQEVVDLTV
jgi:hypothetical protein